MSSSWPNIKKQTQKSRQSDKKVLYRSININKPFLKFVILFILFIQKDKKAVKGWINRKYIKSINKF